MIMKTLVQTFSSHNNRQSMSLSDKYRDFCKHMGYRSILLAVLIFVAGSLDTFQIVLAMQGRAFPYPQIMYLLLGIVWLLLLWRLRMKDSYLRSHIKKLLDQHPGAKRPLKTFFEGSTSNVMRLARLRFLVRKAPRQFMQLLFVLLLANVILRLFAFDDIFTIGPIAHRLLPWIVFLALCFYLLWNDIALSKILGAALEEMSREVKPVPSLQQIREQFMAKLSPRQVEIVEMHYVNGTKNQVIADKLGIELVTVKTHINNAGHLWNRFREANNLDEVSLQDFLKGGD